jgi:hypothetical protein
MPRATNPNPQTHARRNLIKNLLPPSDSEAAGLFGPHPVEYRKNLRKRKRGGCLTKGAVWGQESLAWRARQASILPLAILQQILPFSA